MICTPNALSKWENFPKGLRVLLLDEDDNSAAETKSKLESMDYIVTIFSNENEALSAISKKPESFHVALVEVSTSNKNGSFKFLEAAKDLPTIMTSNIHCLSTMMKCIALGAVEFLHKPLSEDKLKNIWQHVVHKAFNVGGTAVSESLKPVKESIISILHLESENGKNKVEKLEEREHLIVLEEKDPAPSTPQLKQGARLLDDGDCHDNANCSTENANCWTEKERADNDARESKSAETSNCVVEVNENVRQIGREGDSVVKEEVEGEADDLKSDNTVSLYGQLRQNKDDVKDSCGSNHLKSKASGIRSASGNKANRKKVDWTPELHKKFVQGVEQLGVDQAIPSRILELMKVEGLTRHNVASHLQKYRMHWRSILPKEEDHERRWIQPRDHQLQQRSYNHSHRPIMGYPPVHQPQPSNLVGPVYPVWELPGVPPPSAHLWYPPGYPPWQPMENWHWKPPYSSGMQANAWGCPVMRPTNSTCHTSKNSWGFQSSVATDNGFKLPHPNSLNLHPDEDVIDKVVKEAINKPWLPLPLGLKPPSTDSVLAELSRQGFSTVRSPSLVGSRLC